MLDRPLKPDNDEKINLNKTKYRNQTTKVALAIKEIILGLKTTPITQVEEKTLHKELLEEIKKEERSNEQVKLTKLTKRKLLSGSIIIIAVVMVIAFTDQFSLCCITDSIVNQYILNKINFSLPG